VCAERRSNLKIGRDYRMNKTTARSELSTPIVSVRFRQLICIFASNSFAWCSEVFGLVLGRTDRVSTAIDGDQGYFKYDTPPRR
jgi:hypothetical protein